MSIPCNRGNLLFAIPFLQVWGLVIWFLQYQRLGSSAFVVTMSGVTSEGPEETDYIRRLTSFRYYSSSIGWAWSGIDWVIEAR